MSVAAPVPGQASPADVPTRVWDLPTRLFHWALTGAIAGSFITGSIGGNAMVWHFRCGYAVLALLAFRLLWGVFGGRWSRFGSFIYGPGAVLRYLRGTARPGEYTEVGHNPLGAFSVFALLGLLLLQVATGLVADDEIASIGPLNRFVSSAAASQATWWHADVGRWVIVALVALHIAAIVFYLLRRKNLVRAMISGDKQLPAGTPAADDSGGRRLLALVLMALCAAGVAWVVSLGG